MNGQNHRLREPMNLAAVVQQTSRLTTKNRCLNVVARDCESDAGPHWAIITIGPSDCILTTILTMCRLRCVRLSSAVYLPRLARKSLIIRQKPLLSITMNRIQRCAVIWTTLNGVWMLQLCLCRSEMVFRFRFNFAQRQAIFFLILRCCVSFFEKRDRCSFFDWRSNS